MKGDYSRILHMKEFKRKNYTEMYRTHIFIE